MAITLASGLRDTVTDTVADEADAGTTDANGDLVIKDGSSVILVTIELQNPAFDAASSAVVTMQGTPLQGTAAATGVAATFEIRDRDNNVVLTGSVTATGGGGDIELTTTSITASDIVQINSFTLTGPA